MQTLTKHSEQAARLDPTDELTDVQQTLRQHMRYYGWDTTHLHRKVRELYRKNHPPRIDAEGQWQNDGPQLHEISALIDATDTHARWLGAILSVLGFKLVPQDFDYEQTIQRDRRQFNQSKTRACKEHWCCALHVAE